MPYHDHDTHMALQDYRRHVSDSLQLLHDARYAIAKDGDEQEAYRIMGKTMQILLAALATEEVVYRFTATARDATSLHDLSFE